MAGQTLDLRNILSIDEIAIQIANKYTEWNSSRQSKISDWEEIRKYIYATDTSQTTNAKLPWKNKTTVPKLTQIRDNLNAHYTIGTFPKSNWLSWNASNKDADQKEKRDAILAYMNWVVAQPSFRSEMAKIILDYIDYGNCFATVEFVDERIELSDRDQVGYVGPRIKRISPLDIVFNPISPSFVNTPKIIRSLITIGELKKKLEQISIDENIEEYRQLFNYLVDYRQTARSGNYEASPKDTFLIMDGFSSFNSYLDSDYVEVLTFYGDLYDYEANELLENYVITVVDRHKLISKKPNPSYFGTAPVFHCGWRPRQDNLWAMGPLDNLIGIQYRIDHIENLKADVFDLIAFPVLKIKGSPPDFNWGPAQRIYCQAPEDDVEMLAPPFQILQADSAIEIYSNTMEVMAGSPKEALGFRTPGEKTAYEVSRLENAAARVFQNKILQFEEQFLEPLLNAMLELARRNISGVQEINVFDDEFRIQTFLSVTASDISGAGQLKPVGARHFVEKAEILQNLNNLFNSSIGHDPLVLTHFSSVQTAKMLEEVLDLKQFEIVQPYVRLAEQLEAQHLQAAGQEQLQMAIQTPSGLTPDDTDQPHLQQQQ